MSVILPVLPVLATSTSMESSNPLVSLPSLSTPARGCLTIAFGSSEDFSLGVVLSVCRHARVCDVMVEMFTFTHTNMVHTRLTAPAQRHIYWHRTE